MSRTLVIGATSAIAEATERLLAARGDALYLVGRNEKMLAEIAADLTVRGCPRIAHESLDANDLSAHEAMLGRAESFLGAIDIALLAYGTLPDQKRCESSVELTVRELHTNAISIVALLTRLANRMEQRRAGIIAVISSVAGDRGRGSNYVYGSSKALVTAFLSGLRQRLRPCGVAIVTIKPGFGYADDCGLSQRSAMGEARAHRARHRSRPGTQTQHGISTLVLAADHVRVRALPEGPMRLPL